MPKGETVGNIVIDGKGEERRRKELHLNYHKEEPTKKQRGSIGSNEAER